MNTHRLKRTIERRLRRVGYSRAGAVRAVSRLTAGASALRARLVAVAAFSHLVARSVGL